jgi:hypothetical protein
MTNESQICAVNDSTLEFAQGKTSRSIRRKRRIKNLKTPMDLLLNSEACMGKRSCNEAFLRIYGRSKVLWLMSLKFMQSTIRRQSLCREKQFVAWELGVTLKS